LFGVSKQAFHKRKEEPIARKVAQEAFALEHIRSVRAVNPGIGGMKLWFMYKKEFPDRDRIGRDRFEDIVNRYGFKIRNKKRKPRTTDSTHGLPTFPNLVYEFIPTAINQLWVTDITYIAIMLNEQEYAFAYLTLIMDGYSHEIIGWAIGNTLETQYPIQALEMAKKRLIGVDEDVIENLIHHSDRGVQYASKEYVSLLQKDRIRISMTENGDPKENAMAERVNSTIKNELLKDKTFHSVKEARDALEVAIDFYNKRRPHMSIDMMTPEEAAKCNGKIDKKWYSYREEAIKRGRDDANR
jgi:putative transposase